MAQTLLYGRPAVSVPHFDCARVFWSSARLNAGLKLFVATGLLSPTILFGSCAVRWAALPIQAWVANTRPLRSKVGRYPERVRLCNDSGNEAWMNATIRQSDQAASTRGS